MNLRGATVISCELKRFCVKRRKVINNDSLFNACNLNANNTGQGRLVCRSLTSSELVRSLEPLKLASNSTGTLIVFHGIRLCSFHQHEGAITFQVSKWACLSAKNGNKFTKQLVTNSDRGLSRNCEVISNTLAYHFIRLFPLQAPMCTINV